MFRVWRNVKWTKLRNIFTVKCDCSGKIRQKLFYTQFFLFVYFNQISFTMKDNQINGYNKNKTRTKIWKKRLHPLMMMELKCTVAWLIVCWPHESQQSKPWVIDAKVRQLVNLIADYFIWRRKKCQFGLRF